MNKISIVNQALRRMGEATSPAHWGGTTPVFAWFNSGKRQFELDTRIYFATVGTTVTASGRLFALPTSMFHVVQLRHKGNYLTKTSMEELLNDEQGSTWIKTKGTPSSWYRGEGFKYGLYPIPTGGQGGTIIAEGYRTSPDITTNTGVPLFPPQYHAALEERLVMSLCEEDSDASRSMGAWQIAAARYQQYVREARAEGWPSTTRLIVHKRWGR